MAKEARIVRLKFDHTDAEGRAHYKPEGDGVLTPTSVRIDSSFVFTHFDGEFTPERTQAMLILETIT